MDKKDKKALESFVTEYKRVEEQDFAATFSGNPLVELFFILENNCYTDGKHIVLDPHIMELFCDDSAWIKTIKFMKGTGFTLDFTNRLLTLSWITRAVNIHESSHVLYTNFPSIATKGNHGKTYRMLLASVSNIVEDAFIDAKALENYSNCYAYIYMLRVLTMLRSHFFNSSTTEDNLRDVNIEQKDRNKIADLLNYFGAKYVYPMFDVKMIDYIEKEIEYLDPLFAKATTSGDPFKRDRLSVEITDYLFKEVMGRTDDDDREESAEEAQALKELQEKLKELLVDFEIGTGAFNYGNEEHNGITTTDARNVRRVSIEELSQMLGEASSDVAQAIGNLIQASKSNDVTVKGSTTTYEPGSITNNNEHKKITLKEIISPVDIRLRPAYESIRNKYKININSFNRQFTKLLKERHEFYGSKKIIGAVLSSKNFADPKERFWKQKEEEIQIPDLAITFMLDGSGSMNDIIDDAKSSLIIVHETLKQFGIKHSIVLHKALYSKYEMEHHVLLPFNEKKGQEYSILKSIKLENTREGLSLLWCDKYLKKVSADHKIIVMISDGFPEHNGLSTPYFPPVSVIDSRNARIKLESLGYTVIAIALHNCYDKLIKIYDTVIDCPDITKLTGKLLQLISSEIEKY